MKQEAPSSPSGRGVVHFYISDSALNVLRTAKNRKPDLAKNLERKKSDQQNRIE